MIPARADYCPHCGVYSDGPDVPLERDGLRLTIDGLSYGDGPPRQVIGHQRDMLALLIRRGRVSIDVLETLLFADSTSAKSLAKVYAHRVRARLEGTPFTIRNIWGWGYELVKV